MMRVPLGTEIDDPVERLRAIRQHTARRRDRTGVGARNSPTSPSTRRPRRSRCRRAARRASSASASGAARQLHDHQRAGAAVPLYLNGARMTYFSAIMPISDGMGLVFAVTSTTARSSFRRPRAASRSRIRSSSRCASRPFQDYLALASGGQPARRKPRPSRNGKRKAWQAAGKPRRGGGARRLTPAGDAGVEATQAACIRLATLVDRAHHAAPERPPCASACASRSARIHITAALKPSPSGCRYPDVLVLAFARLDARCLGWHDAVGHRVDAGRGHGRRRPEHLGANVREVRDRAHRVGEVAVQCLHERPDLKLSAENRIGLPSEITVRTHSGALWAA